MRKLIAAVFVVALCTLCLSETEGLAQRGGGQRGGGQGGGGGGGGAAASARGATPAFSPPVFLREDFKFDKSVPNVNDEREPEHPIAPTDVANPNLEVRLYGDKAGTRTVIQPY